MNKLFFCLFILVTQITTLYSQGLEYSVKSTSDFVFFGTNYPTVDLSLKNIYMDSVRYNISCSIATDKGKMVYLMNQKAGIAGGDSTDLSFSFYSADPGFYKVTLEDRTDTIKELNICYDPEKIYKLYPDERGTEAFLTWLNRRSNYNNASYRVKKVKYNMAKRRDAYLVSMRFANGETLSGYYLVPLRSMSKDIVTVVRARMLYDEEFSLQKEVLVSEHCIDFIYTVDKPERCDSLFYTNALHKYSAILDFLSSRRELEGKKMFATGDGLSGGLALAAAAIDPRISAVAVYNPYLDERVLGASSNMLLGRVVKLVKCPILYGMGLQDELATPRRLFDSYNLINTPKEYYIFPFASKEMDSNWSPLSINFLLKYAE